MNGEKLGWIVPVFVLIALIATIWVGVSQFNSNDSEGVINNSAISGSDEWQMPINNE